jgi:hypothetical protein
VLGGDRVLLVEELSARTTLTYRFTYTVQRLPEPARSFRMGHDQFFDQLTGFSGAVVKQSETMQKVLTWELVPLKGRSPRIKARCEIMLDGVPDVDPRGPKGR